MSFLTKTTVLEIVGALILALLIFLGVHFTLESRQVEGTSMLPSLESGQRVLISKAAYWFGEPQRGDVVVFYDVLNDKYIIHRIIGLPHETVEIRDGQLYVDGEFNEEPYVQDNMISRAPEKVPYGCYLIAGDNRNSTRWDIVPRSQIVGKAWLCYWPLSDWRLVRGHSYP